MKQERMKLFCSNAAFQQRPEHVTVSLLKNLFLGLMVRSSFDKHKFTEGRLISRRYNAKLFYQYLLIVGLFVRWWTIFLIHKVLTNMTNTENTSKEYCYSLII